MDRCVSARRRRASAASGKHARPRSGGVTANAAAGLRNTRLARDSGQIVLAMGNEGDIGPTILRLAGPTRDSSMPWLREFGSIDDINFTRDGSWALFVKPVRGGRQGGDVYLAATGSEQATRVLASTADRSYASPVPRPLGRR